MNSRTEPTDAIERLAWALNYHKGESISINKLAEKAGLSWATTKKYAQLLEVLNRISPDIDVNSDGITVNAIGDNLDNLNQEKDLQLAIYVLHHASIEGKTDDTIAKDRHTDVLEKYDSTIEELESVGWIECTDDTIRITPEGAAIAGPAKSKYRNTDLKDSTTVPEITIIQRSETDEWHQETTNQSSTRWEQNPSAESGSSSDFTNDKFRRVEDGIAT